MSATLPATLLLLAICNAGLTAAATQHKCYNNGFARKAWPYCVTVGQHAAVHWRIEEADKRIVFGVDFNARLGWFGVGISPTRMQGADIWVTQLKNGKWRIDDYFSEGFKQPEMDLVQNVKLMYAERDSKGTRAVFRRRLVTCDKRDNNIVADEALNLLVAWGVEGTEFGYHGQNRAYRLVTLMPTDKHPVAAKPDTRVLQVMDIMMPQSALPAQETTYLCRNVPMPMDKKRHIVGLDYIEDTPYIHHLIIYGCYAPPKRTDDAVFDCSVFSEMECLESLVVGTPGVTYFGAPEEAGYAIGPDGFSYLAIQAHYHNPNLTAGVVDSSGFKAYYTDELRQHDMGGLWLGSQSFAPIPPGSPNYAMTPFICPSTCTRKFPHPITVYANFFHMHSAGYSIITRHYRNGTELDPLGWINYYDFNDQRATVVKRVVQPGDVLMHQCTMRTLGRVNATAGGPGSNDEMCYNIMSYYPAMKDIQYCASSAGANYQLAACMSNTEATMVLERKANVTALIQQGRIVPVPPSERELVNMTRRALRCTFVRQPGADVLGYSGYGSP